MGIWKKIVEMFSGKKEAKVTEYKIVEYNNGTFKVYRRGGRGRFFLDINFEYSSKERALAYIKKERSLEWGQLVKSEEIV